LKYDIDKCCKFKLIGKIPNILKSALHNSVSYRFIHHPSLGLCQLLIKKFTTQKREKYILIIKKHEIKSKPRVSHKI